jgi:hypothetical protein
MVNNERIGLRRQHRKHCPECLCRWTDPHSRGSDDEGDDDDDDDDDDILELIGLSPDGR